MDGNGKLEAAAAAGSLETRDYRSFFGRRAEQTLSLLSVPSRNNFEEEGNSVSRDNAKIPTKSLTVRRDRASQSVKLTCEYLLQAGMKELAYISRIQVLASQRILHGNEIQPECKKEISLSCHMAG